MTHDSAVEVRGPQSINQVLGTAVDQYKRMKRKKKMK